MRLPVKYPEIQGEKEEHEDAERDPQPHQSSPGRAGLGRTPVLVRTASAYPEVRTPTSSRWSSKSAGSWYTR
jgi:hypothetical protein